MYNTFFEETRRLHRGGDYLTQLEYKANQVEKQGSINCYTCKNCNNQHLILLLDDGVTPFMKDCPFCGNAATSNFYRLPPLATIIIEYVAYKPDVLPDDEFVRQHVENGGLIFGKLSDVRRQVTNET